MGQFLMTGIITEFLIYVDSDLEEGMDPEKNGNDLAGAVVRNPECFALDRKGERMIWRLRPDVIAVQLHDFCKKYFSDFYREQSRDYERSAKPMLDSLAKAPSAEVFYRWFGDGDVTMDKDNELIIHDDEVRSVIFANRKVRVRITFLRLTSEGKIMYEEIEQHLEFFESAMRCKYADDLLGGSLMITIG